MFPVFSYHCLLRMSLVSWFDIYKCSSGPIEVFIEAILYDIRYFNSTLINTFAIHIYSMIK